MSWQPNSQKTLISAAEVPRAQPDQQAPAFSEGRVAANRDCREAGLIRSRSGQASWTQTWIDNIELYRFPLALAVVAVHSGEFVAGLARTRLSAGDSLVGLWFVDFLITISRLATPSFLLIAGLIFCKDGEVSPDQYRRKLKSRCRTLLIPYLAWNFIAVLLLCAPSALKYFLFQPGSYSYTPVTAAGLAKWMIGWPIYPADGPLWFVRDLMVLILILPILSFIPRRLQMIGLGTLLIYWLLSPINVIPGGVPRAFSVLFFMTGIALGMNQAWLRACANAKWVIYVAAGVLLFSAAGVATCSNSGGDYSGLRLFLEKAVRLSGALLVVCAGAKSRFPGWLSSRLHRLAPMAFFLFASHYLALGSITSLFVADQGSWGKGHEVLLLALVSSTTIAVSLGAYFVLKRQAPSLLGILDGNRSARSSARNRLRGKVDAPLSTVGAHVQMQRQ